MTEKLLLNKSRQAGHKLLKYVVMILKNSMLRYTKAYSKNIL